MPLKTRSRTPPGGWDFRQPQAAWTMPLPLAKNFATAVAAIAAMRKNNRRLGLTVDPNAIAVELDEFTCARLRHDPQWCAAGEDKKKPPPSPPGKASSRLPRDVLPLVKLAAAVSRNASGVLVLKDWLGDGAVPVTGDAAQARATVCIDCPKNVRGNWQTLIPAEIAGQILKQLRVKEQVGLTLLNEHELGTCAVCLCHLPLKVYVPLNHIAAHTSEAVWSELPAWCWQRVEAGR